MSLTAPSSHPGRSPCQVVCAHADARAPALGVHLFVGTLARHFGVVPTDIQPVVERLARAQRALARRNAAHQPAAPAAAVSDALRELSRRGRRMQSSTQSLGGASVHGATGPAGGALVPTPGAQSAFSVDSPAAASPLSDAASPDWARRFDRPSLVQPFPDGSGGGSEAPGPTALTLSATAKRRPPFRDTGSWTGDRTEMTFTLLHEQDLRAPGSDGGGDGTRLPPLARPSSSPLAAPESRGGGGSGSRSSNTSPRRRRRKRHGGGSQGGSDASAQGADRTLDYRPLVAGLRPLLRPSERLSFRALYWFDTWDVRERGWLGAGQLASCLTVAARTPEDVQELVLGVRAAWARAGGRISRGRRQPYRSPPPPPQLEIALLTWGSQGPGRGRRGGAALGASVRQGVVRTPGLGRISGHESPWSARPDTETLSRGLASVRQSTGAALAASLGRPAIGLTRADFRAIVEGKRWRREGGDTPADTCLPTPPLADREQPLSQTLLRLCWDNFTPASRRMDKLEQVRGPSPPPSLPAPGPS